MEKERQQQERVLTSERQRLEEQKRANESLVTEYKNSVETLESTVST